MTKSSIQSEEPDDRKEQALDETCIVDGNNAEKLNVSTADFATKSRGKDSWAIGPHKILNMLGQGGMGSVFLAEQEKPVRRRTALKLTKDVVTLAIVWTDKAAHVLDHA